MVRPSAVITPMTDTTRPARQTSPPPESSAVGHPSPRPEVAPIIRSKIQPPALRPTTLSRQRLLDQLTQAASCRVTLLVAEAGYGKTTLLADFAEHSGLRTLWYRLDATDTDPITWANYLIAAGREHMPAFGQSTSALLSQVSTASPPNSVIVASLVEELRELGDTPSALVLDDFHAVDTSSEARDFVERLVRDAPQWLRLVIATRRRPTLQLGRIEAMGELAHVSTDDLRFSLPETERLFADAYGFPLEADVLQDVDVRTKGWAASLQLFYGSIRGKSTIAVRTLARSLSGASSPVYDFLAEEVLGNVPDEIEQFVIRASILDLVTAGTVVALFADLAEPPSIDQSRDWLEEADRLGLLSRTSQTSDARQIHPLLRDFLSRRLAQLMDGRQISELHVRVAKAVETTDPLVASKHYLEAGQDAEAMRCLGSSVMLTMGSGQWGFASGLIDRLRGVPADPAVAAIHARKLIEEGDLAGAGRLLEGADVSDSPPDVRAVFRHAKLSLGWRTGDRELMFATLEEVKRDTETPQILADIAQVFIDASPMSPAPVPLTVLSRRMEQMSKLQREAGHTYYAAISLHNAAIAAFAAGRAQDAVRLCNGALETYELLSVPPSERYSTHAVLATCWFELGDAERAEQHVALGLSSGEEQGDVHAEFAYMYALVGSRDRAGQLLASADSLFREGLSDLQGATTANIARAFMSIATNPEASLRVLAQLPTDRPLDVGNTLSHEALQCLGLLLAGRAAEVPSIADTALDAARLYSARPAEVRLAIARALAREDGAALRAAISDAASVGNLALLELADAIGASLALLSPLPDDLLGSMRRWPRRWLPVLRRQLSDGPTADGRAAAAALDVVGEFEDVARLRAYAKTYAKRNGVKAGLGYELAGRVAPTLQINDLGRVMLAIGPREFGLSRARRKPASLLAYLLTRPRHTATREQVLDELWPDADPVSGANSLNQSLFFLRREIDPWYEEGLSVDYVRFEGDLVWLDPELTRVASSDFLSALRDRAEDQPAAAVLATLARYSGQFAPEFEYEEWAIGWRSRLHAAYLDFVHSSLDKFVAERAPAAARDIATRALEVDPSAREIELKLVRIYWSLGAVSAAAAQFSHLVTQDQADGLEVPSFEDVVSGTQRSQ